MVYDKSDRWLYRPLSYRTERLCTRTLCDKSEIRPFVVKESTNSAARSVSISHHSDGKNSCDYFYSRDEKAGPQKNKTVTEKHCRIVDDGTMPQGWKNPLYDDHWWHLRTPSLIRAHQLSIKPW